MHIRFSFDFISPYAYFAWTEVRGLARRTDATVSFHPVLFAGLLNHWEHKGPAEIPAKRLFTVKQTARRAARMGIDFTWPARHPFNPLMALRASLPQVAGDQQEGVIDALYAAIWGQGADGMDPAALTSALDQRGLDGAALIDRTRDPVVKKQLVDDTNDAIHRGLWGVPTIEIGTELFWGHDAMDDVEAFLRGEDPIDVAAIEALATRIPAGATRK